MSHNRSLLKSSKTYLILLLLSDLWSCQAELNQDSEKKADSLAEIKMVSTGDQILKNTPQEHSFSKESELNQATKPSKDLENNNLTLPDSSRVPTSKENTSKEEVTLTANRSSISEPNTSSVPVLPEPVALNSVGQADPEVQFSEMARSGHGSLGLIGTGSGGGGNGAEGRKGQGRTRKRKSTSVLDRKKVPTARRKSLGSSQNFEIGIPTTIDQIRDQLHGYPNHVNLHPLSTFSMDVDRTSYTRMRGALELKQDIPSHQVKIEGFVNAYPYQLDPPPADSPEPFSLTAELSDSPFTSEGGDMILRVALQAKERDDTNPVKSNLVFLVDVSGSMCAIGKLDLIKKTLTKFIKTLNPDDQMSLVTYSGKVKTLLRPTSAQGKGIKKMQTAIRRLSCAGRTAGGAGLERAYELAQEGWIEGGNNRVLVATDGDFNMGISSVNEIKAFISEKRQTGVYLSMLGFGQKGYNDENMGALARAGNGNYAFIDRIEEGERALQKELTGTLKSLATDLKLQVEFNPEHVLKYRLLGYKKRRLAASDFQNDAKDAAELGTGQQVTAIYELYTQYRPVTPKLKVSYPCGDRQVATHIDCPDRKGDEGAPPANRLLDREWGVFKVRYKSEVGLDSQELSYPIRMGSAPLMQASHDHRMATTLTLFAEALKNKWPSFAYLRNRNQMYKRDLLFFRSFYTQANLLNLIKPQQDDELNPNQKRALEDLQNMIKRVYKLMSK